MGFTPSLLLIRGRERHNEVRVGCRQTLANPKLDEVFKQVWGKDSENFSAAAGPYEPTGNPGYCLCTLPVIESGVIALASVVLRPS